MVCGPKMVEELQKGPDDALSFDDAAFEVCILSNYPIVVPTHAAIIIDGSDALDHGTINSRQPISPPDNSVTAYKEYGRCLL